MGMWESTDIQAWYSSEFGLPLNIWYSIGFGPKTKQNIQNLNAQLVWAYKRIIGELIGVNNQNIITSAEKCLDLTSVRNLFRAWVES